MLHKNLTIDKFLERVDRYMTQFNHDHVDFQTLSILAQQMEDDLITPEQKIFLKQIYENGYTYISADQNGDIFAYTGMPTRESTYWTSDIYDSIELSKIKFLRDLVTWEDPEPFFLKYFF